MKKILVLANNDAGLYKFRKELIEELIKNNEVFISLPHGKYIPKLIHLGCKFVETKINRRGTNPLTDFKLLINYINMLKEIKPDVVLTYTIKPNVYGGIACRLMGTPYISNITGLGTAVENGGVLQKIAMCLYKLALKKASCVFFQNKENANFFIENKVLKGKYRLISGSGVNLTQHSLEEYPPNEGINRLLFIGRIMKSKGIDELFEAAQIVRKSYPNTEFHFVGEQEEDYKAKINQLMNEGIIYYHGRKENVHTFIKKSHAIINPSHHEGMSNVLLESASTGRPIIASNVPGCKETFDEGVSGLGFEVKNVDSLVKTIIKFVKLPYEAKREMGLAGRRKMEKEFSRDIVVKAYLEEIKFVFGG